MKIYIIGSLKNPKVPEIAQAIRECCPSYEVFDDWYAVGPDADDYWQAYEIAKGRNMRHALEGKAALHTYLFDLDHLETSDAALLIAPAGKSAHLELGWMLGKGRQGYILLDKDPERWDVMYNFADKIYYSLHALLNDARLWEYPGPNVGDGREVNNGLSQLR